MRVLSKGFIAKRNKMRKVKVPEYLTAFVLTDWFLAYCDVALISKVFDAAKCLDAMRRHAWGMEINLIDVEGYDTAAAFYSAYLEHGATLNQGQE